MNKQGTKSKSKASSRGSKKDKTAADEKQVAPKLKAKVTEVKEEPEEVVVVEEVLNKSSKVLKGPKAGPSKCSSAAVNPAVQGECNGVRKQVKRKLNEVVVDEGRKKSRMVAEGTSKCAPAAVHPAVEGAAAAAEPHSASIHPAPFHEQISATEMHELVEDAMQNVEDIDELLKSQQTERMDSQSLLAAPAMISEATPLKFRSLNFYWLQMFWPKIPGSLYIFGKVKTPPPGDGFSSCCVILKNLDRRLYLLPREKKSDGTPVDFRDVYNEFEAVICPKYGITSFKAERVTKKHLFNIQAVSQEAEYVEIRYSGSLGALPYPLNGKTFSHARHAHEHDFLADKRLNAPSWLRTFCWQQVQPDQQRSRCKFEFTCEGSSLEIHPNNSTFPTPDLILASMNLQCVDDKFTKQHRIAFAAVAVNRNFHLESPLAPNGIFQDYFGLLAKPPGQNWRLAKELAGNKRIVELESEQKLIERLVEKLGNLDVDVFLGGSNGFEVLLDRMKDLKIQKSSGIGRLSIERPLGLEEDDIWNTFMSFAGRLILDMDLIYYGVFFNCFTYSLSLRMPSEDHEPFDMTGQEVILLSHSPQGFSALVKRGLYECVRHINTINELEAIPLAFQISGIVGASRCGYLVDVVRTISSCFLGVVRAKYDRESKDYWDEYCSEKELDESGRQEDEAQTELTSKGGFCDNYVLRLDFQHESIQRSARLQEFMAKEDNGGNEEEPTCSMRDDLRRLCQRWKEVKRTLVANNLTEVEMQKNNILLKALAWTLDTITKGFPPFNSTDHDKEKSHAVILQLGETLRAVDVELVLAFEDWVVVDTKSQDYSTVVEINRKVVDEISRTHPLLLVTRGAIQCFSLFNMDTRKSLSLSGYTKDVDPFVADMARACFHEILFDQSDSDIRRKVGNILQEEVAKLRDGTIELEKLLLTKTLSKHPKEYEKAAQEELEDHVRVALRMNKYGKLRKKFRKGDNISYLVGINGHLYHSSEIICGLKFNEQFYWDEITHPIVSKILKMVAGVNGNKLADELGFGPPASKDPK